MTDLYIYFARQHRWPLVFRVISMLTTTGSIFSLYALFLSLVLHGNTKQQLTQTTPPLSTTTPLPSAIETPSPPKPVAITAVMSSGVFRMGVTQTEATSAKVADDRVPLIISGEMAPSVIRRFLTKSPIGKSLPNFRQHRDLFAELLQINFLYLVPTRSSSSLLNTNC